MCIVPDLPWSVDSLEAVVERGCLFDARGDLLMVRNSRMVLIREKVGNLCFIGSTYLGEVSPTWGASEGPLHIWDLEDGKDLNVGPHLCIRVLSAGWRRYLWTTYACENWEDLCLMSRLSFGDCARDWSDVWWHEGRRWRLLINSWVWPSPNLKLYLKGYKWEVGEEFLWGKNLI